MQNKKLINKTNIFYLLYNFCLKRTRKSTKYLYKLFINLYILNLPQSIRSFGVILVVNLNIQIWVLD